MSRRRHAPHHGAGQPLRPLAAALAMVIGLAMSLPGVSLAQPGKVTQAEIENDKWQLLEYRDINGKAAEVPPGIGVTFLPFGGVINGTAACGTYEAAFSLTPRTITIDPPAIKAVPCDPSAQAVDDAFYRALDAAAALSLDGNILSLYDGVTDEPLLSLTRAAIPLDPTIAPWVLARVGDSDGGIETVTAGAPKMEFLRGGGSGDRLTGRVVGSTGCGAFVGSYQTDDSVMHISDVDYRLTNCTETLKRQAQDFVDTLEEITDYHVLPAGLTLEDATRTARLALSPSIELGDQVWTPTELLDENGEVLGLSNLLSTSAVQFFGGKTQGLTACRFFDGRSLSSGLALSTFRLKLDEDLCPAPNSKKKNAATPRQDVEDAFLSALEATASQALRGDELELLDSDGVALMRLVPQAELQGPTWVLWKLDRKPGKGGQREVREDTPTPITATFSRNGVVTGDTGAANQSFANDYLATFATPGAAKLEIEDLIVNGQACKGRKNQRKAMCVQQAEFTRLMEGVTGVIPRKGDLRLLRGPDWVLWFCNAAVTSSACPASLEPSDG